MRLKPCAYRSDWPAPLTVADAMQVPEVRALVEDTRDRHMAALADLGHAHASSLCPVCEVLAPFLAKTEAKRTTPIGPQPGIQIESTPPGLSTRDGYWKDHVDANGRPIRGPR
jgi:hypothetical protein